MELIESYLKESYLQKDDAKVIIEVESTIGDLRNRSAFIDQINPAIVKIRSVKKPPASSENGSSGAPHRVKVRVKRELILGAMSRKGVTADYIAEATGIDKIQITKALSRYCKEGRVERIRNGVFSLPASAKSP